MTNAENAKLFHNGIKNLLQTVSKVIKKKNMIKVKHIRFRSGETAKGYNCRLPRLHAQFHKTAT